MRRLALGLAVAALATVPSPAAAQAELGFSIGAFWPLGGGWTPAIGSAGQAGRVDRRQIAAHVLHARLSYWTPTRLGLEAALGFSPSQVALTDTRTRDVGGRVILSSVRALYRLVTLVDGKPGSGFSRWDFNAGAGAGLMWRSGSAWANVQGTTHPAAMLCFDARTHLIRAAKVRVGFEDWVSWATFDRGLQSETRGRVQHDVVFTLGVQIRLGKAVR